MDQVTADLTCPRCGDVDPWLDTHRPHYVEGRYSNGRAEYTPACTCGKVFQGVGSAESIGTARAVASGVPHRFGEKIYCSDPWHSVNVC